MRKLFTGRTSGLKKTEKNEDKIKNTENIENAENITEIITENITEKKRGRAVIFARLANITAIFAIVFALLFIAFSAFTVEEREIYDKLIRLHVLANSDSDEDQQLKLKVRDKILEKSSTFSELDSIESAEEFYSGKLEMLRDVALETIKQEGYDYDVEISLSKEYYPTREYENFRLPAGEYTSLRIMIGQAQGHNWWCVLYPPLCLSSAKADDAFVDAGFTPDQISFITENDKPKYKVKFKVVEWFSEIKRTIFG